VIQKDRYNQIFQIQVELPDDIQIKIAKVFCALLIVVPSKKVVQTGPEFKIENG